MLHLLFRYMVGRCCWSASKPAGRGPTLPVDLEISSSAPPAARSGDHVDAERALPGLGWRKAGLAKAPSTSKGAR